MADDFHLPVPGVMVHLSPPLDPPMLKGIKVHPDNPFRFEFILDKGDLQQIQLKQETTKLIKYFLASLTIPEDDLWVNLSPYEKNRIIPHSFGLTEMGRDLLAEDYMLKQITASLIYPEDAVGKKFWKRVYEEAFKRFGTTNIPVNTFNKVWIIPDKAVVYENVKAGSAYVIESKLKVMLEQDYLSLEKHMSIQDKSATPQNDTAALGSQVVREIVIPELTREVNENKNFAKLRQVYNSLILAAWYKKKIKDSIMEQVYADKNKIKGLSFPKASVGNPEYIYQQYLKAFKKGVYNYIKEEVDPITKETIPRKYFSGGLGFTRRNLDEAMIITESADMAQEPLNPTQLVVALASIEQVGLASRAMASELAPMPPGGWTLQNMYDYFDNDEDPKEIHLVHPEYGLVRVLNVDPSEGKGLLRLQTIGARKEYLGGKFRYTEKPHEIKLFLQDPTAENPNIFYAPGSKEAEEITKKRILSQEFAQFNTNKITLMFAIDQVFNTLSEVSVDGDLYRRNFAAVYGQSRINAEKERIKTGNGFKKKYLVKFIELLQRIKRITGRDLIKIGASLNKEGHKSLVFLGDMVPLDIQDYFRSLALEKGLELFPGVEIRTDERLQPKLEREMALENNAKIDRLLEGAYAANIGIETVVDLDKYDGIDFEKKWLGASFLLPGGFRWKDVNFRRISAFQFMSGLPLVGLKVAILHEFVQNKHVYKFRFMGSFRNTMGKVIEHTIYSLWEYNGQKNRRVRNFSGKMGFVKIFDVIKEDLKWFYKTTEDGEYTIKDAWELLLQPVGRYQRLILPNGVTVNSEQLNVLDDLSSASSAKIVVQRKNGQIYMSISFKEQSGSEDVETTKHWHWNTLNKFGRPSAGRLDYIGEGKDLPTDNKPKDLIEGSPNTDKEREIQAAFEVPLGESVKVDISAYSFIHNGRIIPGFFIGKNRRVNVNIRIFSQIVSLEKKGMIVTNIGDGRYVLKFIGHVRNSEGAFGIYPKSSSILFDEKNDTIEKLNELDVEKIESSDVQVTLDNLFKELPQDIMPALVTRYGLDIKNVMWGIMGSRIEGLYDKKKIEELIDDKFLKIIYQSSEEQRPLQVDVNQTVEANVPMSAFKASPVDEKDIRHLSKLLDNMLQPESTVDPILQERQRLARLQAVSWIRRMEEEYFFRKYYQNTDNGDEELKPGAKPQEEKSQVKIIKETRDLIEGVRLVEPEGILKEVLKEILDEIDKSLKLVPIIEQRIGKARINLYQLIAIYRMLNNKRILLADEMGLGKTLETIMTFLVSDKPEMLVLGPKQVLGRWMDDIGDFTTLPEGSLEVIVLGDIQISEKLAKNKNIIKIPEEFKYLYSRAPVAPGKRRIIIGNYEAMLPLENYRKTENLPYLHTDFIALDEAHYLKNINSPRTKAILGDLAKGEGGIAAEYKIVMTGTPLENKVSDMFAYLKYMAIGGTEKTEQFLANNIKQFNELFDPKNLTDFSLLHSYLIRHMIRRLKDNVVRGLPVKNLKVALINNSKKTVSLDGRPDIQLKGNYNEQMELYNLALRRPFEFHEEYIDSLEDGNREDLSDSKLKDPKLLRLEQIITDPRKFGIKDSIKFEAAREIIRERIKEGKDVLVFSTYSTVSHDFLIYLSQDPEFQGLIDYMDGEMPEKDRVDAINRFQGDGKQREAGQARIFITTEGSGGVGRNLTQASTVLFLNNPWKASTLMQAIDRAHRIDPVRNKWKKEVEIITFDVDTQISIDRLKARLIALKHMLAEAVLSGVLNKKMQEAFNELDDTLIGAIEDAVFLTDTSPDDFELSFIKEIYKKIEQAVRETDPDKRLALFDELNMDYLSILHHKGSFFANMASLDYLIKTPGFDELRTPQGEAPVIKKVLDLGSGPSTFKRAELRKREELNKAGLFFSTTDYDESREMHKAGIAEGGQIIGSFSSLNQMDSQQYDMVNCSYAYRYAQHPKDFMLNIHRILRPGGVFTLILPPSNMIPKEFFNALEKIGFEPKVGQRALLKTRLDEKTYKAYVEDWGKEYADDLAREVQGEFTYLVVKKTGDSSGADVTDDDFRIQRKIVFNAEKVDRLREAQKEAKIRFIPQEGSIESNLVYANPWQAQEQEDLSEKDQQSYKAVKRLGNRLSSLAIAISSYRMTPDISANQRKRKKLRGEILEKWAGFKREYSEQNKEAWSDAVCQKMAEKLKVFQGAEYIDKWLVDQENAFIDDAVGDLTTTTASEIEAKDSASEAMMATARSLISLEGSNGLGQLDTQVIVWNPSNPFMDTRLVMNQLRRIDMDAFPSDKRIGDEEIRTYLTNKDYRCALSYINNGKTNVIIGFALYRPSGLQKQSYQGHLYRIGIRNGWQKTGKGSALLTQVIKDLRQLGKTELTLTYSNDALGFYQKYADENKGMGISIKQIVANYYAIELGANNMAREMSSSHLVEQRASAAMNVVKERRGGIDLTPANLHVQTQNSNGEIKFHLNAALLARLQNASGFVPVVISIKPLNSLRRFLGIRENFSAASVK